MNERTRYRVAILMIEEGKEDPHRLFTMGDFRFLESARLWGQEVAKGLDMSEYGSKIWYVSTEPYEVIRISGVQPIDETDHGRN